MGSPRLYRAVFGVLVLTSVLLLASSHVRGAGGPSADVPGIPTTVPPRSGVTVITTDSNAWLPGKSAGPRQTSEIVAYAPDGHRMYYNATHDRYWDVDPEPGGRYTVLYSASDHLTKRECRATTVCTRDVVERLNLSTGEVTRLYSRITPYKDSTRWHDVDRLNRDHLVIADIYRDRVFVVNTTSGLTTWSWNAQSNYTPAQGGPFPRDWTHLNDVDVLPDGRLMASVRNMNQVVFLDPKTGLETNWTLGKVDDHSIIYRQHNPDYIPASMGGPAVVVADSENNRIVEYQRRNGSWVRSWQWSDARLQWPRDADRLPDGNTLVSDSNGNRVFEVAPNGSVTWSIDVAFPYEAERLNTGPESAGGHSAAQLGLTSRVANPAASGGSTDLRAAVWLPIKHTVPAPVLNAAVYVIPSWVTPRDALALLLLASTLVAWAGYEWRRSPRQLTLKSPVVIRRR